MVQRALLLAEEGEVFAVEGSRLSFKVESLCVHGSTPGAVALVEAIRAAFVEAGVGLASFVPVPVLGARA